jgi:chromosomal replication initiation ATPase DnaA
MNAQEAYVQFLRTSNLEFKMLNPQFDYSALDTHTPAQTILPLTPENVIRSICNHFDVTHSELNKKSRLIKYVVPRHLAIILLTKGVKMSSTYAGGYFNRHRTNIFNALTSFPRKYRREYMVRLKTNRVLEEFNLPTSIVS